MANRNFGGAGGAVGERMSRPPGENNDARAFAEAMRDARKLHGPTRVPVTQPGNHAPRQGRRPPRAATPTPSSDPTAAFEVEQVGEMWSARANGVDRRLVRKLAAGKIAAEARIDLHGRSRSESIRALDRFLGAAMAAGQRCVLVIHGRGLHSGDGGPALRDAVRERIVGGSPPAANVLACSSAPAAHGGAGATLIWLRR